MTWLVIGIVLICVGLLLEIAQIGEPFGIGTIIAIVGVIVYVYARFTKHKHGRN